MKRMIGLGWNKGSADPKNQYRRKELSDGVQLVVFLFVSVAFTRRSSKRGGIHTTVLSS